MSYVLARSDGRRGIPLKDKSVQCVVTSPPYWGLRDYGESGQIGLEATPEAYVARVVEVFRDVRRVLRDDGTVWLNLGDSYAGGYTGKNDADRPSSSGGPRTTGKRMRTIPDGSRSRPIPPGLKFKELVGIPWRVALALQADGWYLRSDIIWHKPNSMPENVEDRPTNSHEYLFLLSKRAHYYYDRAAIQEKSKSKPHCRAGIPNPDRVAGPMDRTGSSQYDRDQQDRVWGEADIRNKRSVWTVTAKPFKGAHFATFPPDLIEPCIKAGTSEKGACAECGAPWVRIVEKGDPLEPIERLERDEIGLPSTMRALVSGVDRYMSGRVRARHKSANPDRFLGWKPSCPCPPADPVPCLVLDPFNGSGTSGVVSLALKRHYVGLDLSPKYLKMARRRIERPHARPVVERPDVPLPLFDIN